MLEKMSDPNIEVIDLLKPYEPKDTPYDSIISLAQKLLESADVDSFQEIKKLLEGNLRKKEDYISSHKIGNMLKGMVDYLSVEFPMESPSNNFSYQVPVFKENNA